MGCEINAKVKVWRAYFRLLSCFKTFQASVHHCHEKGDQRTSLSLEVCDLHIASWLNPLSRVRFQDTYAHVDSPRRCSTAQHNNTLSDNSPASPSPRRTNFHCWNWACYRQSFFNAITDWLSHNAPRLSAALAFYTLLSISPLLIIATAILRAVYWNSNATEKLIEQLQSVLGDSGAEVVKAILANPGHPATDTVASMIGTGTLLLGASGVLSELQSAMNLIWNVRSPATTGLWESVWQRIKSFGMVLVVGFLLMATLILSTVVSSLGGEVLSHVPSFAAPIHIANQCLSFSLTATLFGLIFKFFPNTKIGWRDVFFGAIVTSLLFNAGNILIGIYLRNAGFATPFGAAGSLVVFVVWIYYSALIFFFGAELTQATAAQREPLKSL